MYCERGRQRERERENLVKCDTPLVHITRMFWRDIERCRFDSSFLLPDYLKIQGHA